MGGQAALELARLGAPIVLAASFHGILATDRPATAQTPVKARLFISHGDADPLVPREQVLDFWKEMDAAGGNWHFHSYAGVKHGFTDPKATRAARISSATARAPIASRGRPSPRCSTKSTPDPTR
jgi:dienelactone hydrolase